jgi:Leucine-rich repeat (LRR) protein
MRYKKHQFESEGLLSVSDIDQFKGPLDQIGTLYLSDKRGLKPLPVKQVLEMVNLQHFGMKWLRGEDFKAFFEMLEKLPRLKELEITIGDGQHLLSTIANLPTLKYLKISGKSLGEFPKEIKKLTNLRTLELWIYQWEHIGRKSHLAALGGLPKLEELVLDAKFNTPSGLGSLKQLKVLEARGLPNDLDGISELTSLEDLTLEYGGRDADVRATEGLHALKRLKIKTSGKITFPPSWAKLEYLEELDLWSSHFPQMPEVISTIPLLKRLTMFSNRLEELPDWICNFSDLEELKLSYNAIKALPEAFANLQNLQKIILDTNALTEFPSAFLQMPALKDISLYENKIVDFPVGPLNFPELEQIILSKNRIAKMPTALLGLPKGEIMLEGNPFVKAFGYKLDQLLQVVSKEDHSAAERLTLLAFSVGDVARALQSATLEHLVVALNSYELKLRAFGADALNQFLPDPFNVDVLPTAIQVLGHTKSNPNLNYEKALTSKGITVNKGDASATDIVVIAERPGDGLDAYLQAGAKPASLAQLVGFVEAIEKPWLRTQAAEQPKVGENFRTLLESGTAENLRIAFGMLASGGMPEQAISSVLAISLFHTDAELKKTASNAFQTYASPALKAFLAANKRNYAVMIAGKLQGYVTEIGSHTEIDARSFTKMASKLNAELLPCFIPYMTGDELNSNCVKDGYLRLNQLIDGQLPQGIFELAQLDQLNLARLRLKEIPLGLERIRGLRSLQLAGNRLSTLPASFAELKNLEVLDLSENSFKSVPEVLQTLPKLRLLNLSKNSLQKLPQFLARFPALRKLEVDQCNFDQFPNVLWDMPFLDDLDLSFDENRIPTSDFAEGIGKLTRLKHLQLWKYPFETFPEAMLLPMLESMELDFSDKIRAIPPWFGKFSRLKILSFKFCGALRQLPAEIGELKNMEFLDLGYTAIAVLPDTFSKLSSLQRIALPSVNFQDEAATLEIFMALPSLQKIFCCLYPNYAFLDMLRVRMPNVQLIR